MHCHLKNEIEKEVIIQLRNGMGDEGIEGTEVRVRKDNCTGRTEVTYIIKGD